MTETTAQLLIDVCGLAVHLGSVAEPVRVINESDGRKVSVRSHWPDEFLNPRRIVGEKILGILFLHGR
jgi:hypothetical protein